MRTLARILGPLLFLKPTHRRCRRILCDLGSWLGADLFDWYLLLVVLVAVDLLDDDG